MEIYHRDHWMIIFHTGTWKDLTKWNEENTIMDWINHMGRIVEHVFSVPSRLRREGQRMKKITWYTMYYLILLYQVQNSRYQAVKGCIVLYQAVLDCNWLYLAVLGCIWLYFAVLSCSRLNQAVLSSARLYLALLDCSWPVLG